MAKTINMKQYNESKAAFIRKHCGTRGFKEYGKVDGERIIKTMCFEDEACWHEITEPVYEDWVVEARGLKIHNTIKLYRTEIWDSENSISRYLYEAA